MEMKAFTDSMFIPLMLQRESFDENTIVSYDADCIMNMTTWVEDTSGLCYIPDLIKIEVTFDGNINDPKFDTLKAEIFSIIATTPQSMIDNEDEDVLSDDENTNMLKNIVNCFSGKIFNIPDTLKIFDDLLAGNWSYRVCTNTKIFPCVVHGQLAFECI